MPGIEIVEEECSVLRSPAATYSFKPRDLNIYPAWSEEEQATRFLLNLAGGFIPEFAAAQSGKRY